MTEDRHLPAKPDSEIVLYQTEDGHTHFQVRLENETVWLPQRQIAELYQVSVPTVNEHLANIYTEGELDSEATIRKFRIVQKEGNRGDWPQGSLETSRGTRYELDLHKARRSRNSEKRV